MRWAVLLSVLVLSGCEGSRSQIQLVADARAGAQAAKLAAPGTARDQIVAALVDDVLTATGSIPGLPKPTMTPDQIALDPSAYAEQAAAAVAKPPPYRPEDQPRGTPSPAGRLEQLGDKALKWGGIAMLIGTILTAVGFVSAWIPLGWVGTVLTSPMAVPLARLAMSAGGASMIIGSAMSWLANYWWAIVLAFILGGIVVAVTHLKDVRKIIDKVRKKGFPNAD